MLALLCLNLDEFEKFNLKHGYPTGDRLLQLVAERLTHKLREMDLVCRLAEDEFAVLLKGLQNSSDLPIVLNKVLGEFQKPWKINQRNYHATASIGVAMAENADNGHRELMRRANTAMHEAKRQGGNQFCLFSPESHHQLADNFVIEADFPNAITHNELRLSLQPQVNAHTNHLEGFEALIRWKHPQRGMMMPLEFIPVLENTQQIHALGHWVIKHSLRLLSQLDKNGFPSLNMAINLSPCQFSDPVLMKVLLRNCEEYQIATERVELEITESMMLQDYEHALGLCSRFKQHDFRLAIDDFGTGYSSFATLNRLPFDTVKFDRSFIMQLGQSRQNQRFMNSMINMMQQMNLTTIAEGVETAQQRELLDDFECDLLQGFHISKPIIQSQLLPIMNQHLHAGAWH
ncbi:putative bifunctional diguanylate cyclase/phosphodiesterase [Dongshaea marina]|uniref:putative bifunctional diguanylate cyclase/phosphodiesterase n=1 Tax=Dongshaea marina TaxID=2047966 RepID=UPI000D3E27FE|nr:bifunctional diguanylate cyclase/phosphodiesterase [Dongshaea marina]